jgi:hypothetical protein
MPKEADYYSKFGAGALVTQIVNYWTGRGFHGIVCTRYQDPDFPTLWFVRSNVGPNGYPPRTKEVWVG